MFKNKLQNITDIIMEKEILIKESIAKGNDVLAINMNELRDIACIGYIYDPKATNHDIDLSKYTFICNDPEYKNLLREKPKRVKKIDKVLRKTAIIKLMYKLNNINLQRSVITSVHDIDYIKNLEYLCQDETIRSIPPPSDVAILNGTDSLNSIYSSCSSVVSAVMYSCIDPIIGLHDIPDYTYKQTDGNKSNLNGIFVNARPPHSKAYSDHGIKCNFINYVAVGAMKALEYEHINKVAIFDMGIEVGEGTRDICCAHNNIKFYSIYAGSELEPIQLPVTTEEIYTIDDVEFIDVDECIHNANNRTEYMKKFKLLSQNMLEYDPDIILISFSTDSHEHDFIDANNNINDVNSDTDSDTDSTDSEDPVLGYLSYNDYDDITKNICNVANECGAKVVSVLDSGYNTSILERLVSIHVTRMMIELDN